MIFPSDRMLSLRRQEMAKRITNQKNIYIKKAIWFLFEKKNYVFIRTQIWLNGLPTKKKKSTWFLFEKKNFVFIRTQILNEAIFVSRVNELRDHGLGIKFKLTWNGLTCIELIYDFKDVQLSQTHIWRYQPAQSNVNGNWIVND